MALDIVVYRAGQEWAEPKLDAFVAGLERHGLKPNERRAGEWRASDLAVVWAHRDTALHELQREAGNHYLVLERGYIGEIEDRRRWTSIGYDGLNGRADFCNAGADAARWDDNFADALEPWKSDGDYALLMGQVRGDASLADLNIRTWGAKVAERLVNRGWTVMFRPHPNDPIVAPADAYQLIGSLSSALAGAGLAVTYNSNSGVDAALAGVPVMAADRGSMAWDVASRAPENDPITPDRTVWCHRLAWTQWLPVEIANGDAWDHLKRKFN